MTDRPACLAEFSNHINMKKTTLFFIAALLAATAFSQRPSKEQMEADRKKLAEAMKKLDEKKAGMSPDARRRYDSLVNSVGANTQMNDAVKQVNTTTPARKTAGLAINNNSNNTAMPEKQVMLLNAMPRITTSAQYSTYLGSLKEKLSARIPQATKNNIDLLIGKCTGKPTQLNNIPPLFFMEQNPEAAVYASVCVALLNKSLPVSQENLTAILHLTGYPQYALPLLEYLNTQFKSDLLLSNTGQCYLSLGDKEKAKTCFMRALAANPDNTSANCGMGFIEANGPTPSAAAPYIEKTMKNGYSETLAKLVSQKNIQLNYKSMKSKVPVIFSPEKYKVRPSALRFEEVEEALAKRVQMDHLKEAWVRKLQQVQNNFDKQTANLSPAAKLELYTGYVSNGMMMKKARFMLAQADNYFNDFAFRSGSAYNNLKFRISKMQDDLKKENKNTRSDIPDPYDACKAMKESLNTYLAKSAELTNDFVSLNIFDFYEYTNQQLYWNKFLMQQEAYDLKFYQTATSLLKAVSDYGNIQALDEAHTVVYDCQRQTAAVPDLKQDQQSEYNCPFSIKIPFGIGSFKSNCKGWSIEGGEAVVFGASHSFQTGEFTVSMGMGGNIEAPFLGGSAGAQMFMTVGSDFIPCDMGMQGSAGIEAIAGPVVIGEESLSATMSIASGLNLDAVHAGEQINLLSVNPKQ